MGNFDSLPDELIFCILQNIEPPITSLQGPARYTTPYYNLCLVSRRFNSIATSILYNTIEHYGPPSFASPARLLRTLKERPNLAQNIKTIRHKAFYAGRLSSWGYPSTDTSVLDLWNTFEIPDWMQLRPRSDDAGDDLELTLLVLQAAKLEKLIVRTWMHKIHWPDLPTWLTGLTRIAHGVHLGKDLGSLHPFSSLRQLHVDVHPTDTTKYFPLFLLPSLTDLTLCHWGEESLWEEDPNTVYGYPWKWRPHSNKIERLTFKLPNVSAKTMSHAIRSCKALKYFQCHELSLEIEGNEWEWYAGISEALLEHRYTLEELSISESLFENDCFTDWGVMGPLSGMHALRKLRIPFYIFIGLEGSRVNEPVLPCNIEKFIVELAEEASEEDCKWFFQSLELALSVGHLPSLHIVEIRCRFLSVCFPINIMSLRQLFQPYDVEVEYYIQLCLVNTRQQLDITRNTLTKEEEEQSQHWVERMKHLPGVVRVESKRRNIVATSISEEWGMAEDKRYTKQSPRDVRWILR